MAKATIKIDGEVMDVLNRSEVEGRMLRLPPVTLERKLYERVNKVLVAAGGKWSKSAKAHVFEQDPHDALGLAMESGEVINKKQAFQEFFTPPEIAESLCDGIMAHHAVLEPSAGQGAIAKRAADTGATVFCCEIQPERCEELRADGRLFVWQGDFLKLPVGLIKPFDVVVMNPPFTGNQDAQHVMKAFEHLRPGGRLLSIMAASASEGARSAEWRRWLARTEHFFESLPDGAFKASGTMVKTVVLTAYKETTNGK